MRYLVTLDDRQVTLELDPANLPLARPIEVRSEASTHEVEVLSPGSARQPTLVTVGSRVYRVDADSVPAEAGRATAVTVNGQQLWASVENAIAHQARSRLHGASAADTSIEAPMPGRVVDIHVKVGDHVDADQSLLSIEAMKMENDLGAPRAGTVAQVRVAAGDTVESGQTLIVLEPA
jgi:biotin carboxyl carrier protein